MCFHVLDAAESDISAPEFCDVQQRVEQKELRVTPVSSTDNLADIGTKKLPAMHLLMHDIGIFDSDKGPLVGHDEHEQKLCKQNLRLITGSSSFKTKVDTTYHCEFL